MRPVLFVILPALSLAAGARAEQPLAIEAAAVPDLIESIEDGAPPAYRLATRRVWLELDTPYSRLARAVSEAQRRDQPVGPELATPAVIASELRLQVGPEPNGDADVSVQRVVAELPDGTKLEAKLVGRETDLVQTRRRKGIKLARVRAVLPLEALVEGVRFRVELKPGPDEALEPGQDWLASVR